MIRLLLFGLSLSLLLAPSVGVAQTGQAPAQQDTVAAAQDTAASALTQSIQDAQPEWTVGFGKIFWAIIVILIGYLAIKYLTLLLERLAEYWTNVRLAIKRVIPIVRILGWTLVIYVVIANILAPPIATLVAITASAGIAVGFASQDILKSIFGGIMILFDKPFQIGDKIEVGKYYGEVVSIGLRTVRVVTADDSLVAIPNNEIINQSVSNANAGEPNCQVVAEFFLPIGIDTVKARQIAQRVAAVCRYVYLNKPIAVLFKSEIHLGRPFLKMRLKAYVFDTRYEFQFASEMTELVTKAFIEQKLLPADDKALIPSI